MTRLYGKVAKNHLKAARKAALGLTVSAISLSTAAAAADFKVGFVTTMTGSNSAIGLDLLDGFNLALQLKGTEHGDSKIEVITADDQQKPDIGRQAAERLIERDRVDLVTGTVFGNILPVVAQATVDLDRIYISINGGARSFAGANCDPNMFFASWQTEGPHEAIGAYAQQEGFKKVYMMAPDYSPGHEMVEGFKRFYKGDVVGEVYTPLSNLDFAAELAKVRQAAPDALYIFYPGGMGVSFLKQFEAAGLEDLPLIGASFSFDQTVLPSVGDAAVGAVYSSFWGEELDNEANKEFVSAYKETYGRAPTGYAAQGYDGALLISAALESLKGKEVDTDSLRTALAEAEFDSVRGSFKFNTNHFPIQDWYWGEVVKGDDGASVPVIRGKVLENQPDAFAEQCQM